MGLGSAAGSSSPGPDVAVTVDREAKEAMERGDLAQKLGFCNAYVERIPDLTPPGNIARARDQNAAYENIIQRVYTPFSPNGRGNRWTLPRLSRMQRWL